MKDHYPDYKKERLHFHELERQLPLLERKVLDEFCDYCRINASEHKVKDVRTIILQMRDIVQKDFDTFTLDDLKDIKNHTMGFNHKKLNDAALLTPEEQAMLLAAARDASPRAEAIIALSLELGSRPQELRLARCSQVSLGSAPDRITLYSGKTRTARTLPIRQSVPALKKWLKNYPFGRARPEDYLFPSQHSPEQPLSRSQFSRIFGNAAARAQIGKNVYAYLFRHTRLTDIRRHIDEQHALAFGGHAKDSKMGAIYNHLNSRDLEMQVLTKLYGEEAVPESAKHQMEQALAKQTRKLAEQAKVMQDLKRRLDQWEERANTTLVRHHLQNDRAGSFIAAHPELGVQAVERNGRLHWKLAKQDQSRSRGRAASVRRRHR